MAVIQEHITAKASSAKLPLREFGNLISELRSIEFTVFSRIYRLSC